MSTYDFNFMSQSLIGLVKVLNKTPASFNIISNFKREEDHWSNKNKEDKGASKEENMHDK